MKEVRFFYNPNAQNGELPDEEAVHAVRVLRLVEGDEIFLMDGKGYFYNAVITETSKKYCRYRILSQNEEAKSWRGRIHVAVAPTKNIDRIEWFAEKATEIGIDELSFLNCQFSERRVVKNERIEKILISAMKQSRKPVLPVLNPLVDFDKFIQQEFHGRKFICHCYDNNLPLLKDILLNGSDKPQTQNEEILVMIGPEGDFSIDEVRKAEQAGFVSVSLGKSRLRTETAALVAAHIMHLSMET